jgi:Gpi18-like mannosyltransferase
MSANTKAGKNSTSNNKKQRSKNPKIKADDNSNLSRHKIWKDVLFIFILTRILIYAISLSSHAFIQRELPADHQLWHDIQPSDNTFLRIWEKWDSIHYLSIMENGYSHFTPEAMNTAFFPLYPLTSYLVNALIQNRTLSFLLVSNLAFLFALFFLYKLVRLDEPENTARKTILYISVFPFSLFFAGAYTESLFLLNLCATFYYTRTAQWGKATLFGFLLTATRLVGIAALPAIFLEYIRHQKEKDKTIDWNVLLFGIMGLGLVAYIAYTWIAFGNPLSIFESSKNGWNRQLAWPWVSIFKTISRMNAGSAFPIFTYNFILAIASLVLCGFTFKKLRLSYSLLSLFLILIPLSSGTLKSFPRYMIVVFPLFVLMAKWGENRYVDMAIAAVSLIYLGLFTALYSNWVYVG